MRTCNQDSSAFLGKVLTGVTFYSEGSWQSPGLDWSLHSRAEILFIHLVGSLLSAGGKMPNVGVGINVFSNWFIVAKLQIRNSSLLENKKK